MLNGIKCQGHEQHLYECYHEEVDNAVECDESSLVAGVICTNCEYHVCVCVCVCMCVCYHDEVDNPVECGESSLVAGVIEM